MSPVTQVLWKRYREDGDLEARAALLDRYLGLVHHCARKVANRVSNEVEFDDLVSAGSIGLVQALEGFDLDRGLAFSTYAMQRVRGAILDELRSRDWRPRSVRARGRQLVSTISALETRLGRAPESREIAEAMGVGLEVYWKMREDLEGGVMVSLGGASCRTSDDMPRLEETIAGDTGDTPFISLSRADRAFRLRQALEALPERERIVLSLYYYEELNLKQIGEVLHVTESRVFQIRSKALRRLRERPALRADVL